MDLKAFVESSHTILTLHISTQRQSRYGSTLLRSQGSDSPNQTVAIALRHANIGYQHVWSPLLYYR